MSYFSQGSVLIEKITAFMKGGFLNLNSPDPNFIFISYLFASKCLPDSGGSRTL